MTFPGYRLPGKPNQRRLAQAAEVISAAERPVLYLGGGLNRAQVPTEDLTELIELIGAPFVTTLTALDVMPSEHPLNLGMPGMHGTVAAVGACNGPTSSSAWEPASTTGSPAGRTPSQPRPR